MSTFTFQTELFESSNMIVILANVVFVIIVQIIFFRYVVSKQIDMILESKATIIQEYLKHDPIAKSNYIAFATSDVVRDIEDSAKKEADLRDEDNLMTTLMWIGVPLVLTVALFMFYVIRMLVKEHDWDSVDTILLCFVIFAYITDFTFYFTVIRQYQFYGDHAIISNMYKILKTKVNSEPITPEGRKVQELLKKINPSNNLDLKSIRSYYQQNEELFKSLGIDEQFVISYAQSKIPNILDIVNFDIVDKIGHQYQHQHQQHQHQQHQYQQSPHQRQLRYQHIQEQLQHLPDLKMRRIPFE